MGGASKPLLQCGRVADLREGFQLRPGSGTHSPLQPVYNSMVLFPPWE